MVKNINGTSKKTYTISNLKHKYAQHGGCASTTCQHKGCSKKVSATAHVMHADNRKGHSWYLTSLCAEHNHTSNKDPIPLRKNATLVPVKSVSK